MPENEQRKPEERPVHPDELMSGISRSSLAWALPVAIVIHVVVILLTSFGYISRAMSHGEWRPHVLNRMIQEETAADSEDETPPRDVAGPAPDEAEGELEDQAPADAKSDDEEPETPVEQRVSETSDERPNIGDDELLEELGWE
jgi:hypothetical protein